jgi:hypothetical protein
VEIIETVSLLSSNGHFYKVTINGNKNTWIFSSEEISISLINNRAIGEDPFDFWEDLMPETNTTFFQSECVLIFDKIRGNNNSIKWESCLLQSLNENYDVILSGVHLVI